MLAFVVRILGVLPAYFDVMQEYLVISSGKLLVLQKQVVNSFVYISVISLIHAHSSWCFGGHRAKLIFNFVKFLRHEFYRKIETVVDINIF